MSENVLEKFLRYVKIDTQSQDGTGVTPSTKKQFDLGNLLLDELKKLGLKDAELDEHCYLFATLPSNLTPNDPAYGKVPTIGLLAHMDTSPDVSGANVKPQIIENYQGGDIVLPGDTSVVIREDENPKLKLSIGHRIVTTDGTTLLGADDKAGVAAIMSAVEYLINHPEIKHGDIRVGFTPDEEIGMGTACFDLKKFGAKYAYTIDGEYPGELNKETFSANGATITVYGRDIHPGSAKDIMINSLRIMADIVEMLPKNMAPETTEKYEPFIHPHTMEGSIGKSTLRMLMRDFNTPGLEVQREILENIVALARVKYPKAKIELEIKNQYRNMKDYFAGHEIVADCMFEAAVRAGVEPYWEPIRGGTDGSRLTEMGLPTPNFYAGGQNFHSRTEWLSVNALETTVNTLIKLAEVWVDKSK
jgi:tripeptide aminopeptidase